MNSTECYMDHANQRYFRLRRVLHGRNSFVVYLATLGQLQNVIWAVKKMDELRSDVIHMWGRYYWDLNELFDEKDEASYRLLRLWYDLLDLCQDYCLFCQQETGERISAKDPLRELRQFMRRSMKPQPFFRGLVRLPA